MNRQISPLLALVTLALVALILFAVRVTADGKKGPTELKPAEKIEKRETASRLEPKQKPEQATRSTTVVEGDKVPAFSIQGPGGPIRSSEYRGSPYVIEFIATWCPHCQRVAPAFAEVFSKSDVPLLTVGAAREPLATVGKWHRSYLPQPMPGRYGVDPDQKVVRTFGVATTPTTAFIDSSGRLEYLVSGEISADEIRTYLQGLR